MKLSIIIPSYNEFPTLGKILSKVESTKIPYEKEIIVVDDGSTDATAGFLKKLKSRGIYKIVFNKNNLGKGASIKKALKMVTGDIVLIQDADLEYDTKDYKKLLEPFHNPKVEVVYGSRILGKNPSSHWTFNLGGKLLTAVANLLFNTKITDEPTGYKIFRTNVIKSINLESKGFEFCPEVTAKLAKRNIRIIEVPITYKPRPLHEKKIKWWDGLKGFYYLFKYKLTD